MEDFVTFKMAKIDGKYKIKSIIIEVFKLTRDKGYKHNCYCDTYSISSQELDCKL